MNKPPHPSRSQTYPARRSEQRAAKQAAEKSAPNSWRNGVLRPKPPEIEAANKRMHRILISAGIFMFVLGLIFPASGTQHLGILGSVINWVADTVPSINKAASVSPMAHVVRGYLGTLALVIPVTAYFLAYKQPLGSYWQRAFFLTKASVFKTFISVYVLGIPIVCLMLWAFWAFPVEPQLGVTPTRGHLFFYLMVTNRLALAILGSVIGVAIATLLYIVLIFILGPVLRLLK